MPNIVINEIDETLVSAQASGTDVAYIPGFADTNSAVYILTGYDDAPTTTLKGTVASASDTYNTHLSTEKPYPCFACNITSKKTWKCTASTESNFTWKLMDNYISPAPENTPILCNTIAEFEEYFGALPYQWVADTASNENEDAFKARTQMPTFSDTSATRYMYSQNDYEKSYIYAKELINMGIPVMYENIVERDSTDNNKKKLPSVSYLYQQLVNCYDNITDKGEYSVKYLTSGAYPTFEYTGASTLTGEFSDTGSFPFSEVGEQTIATPNCSGTFEGENIGGAQSVTIRVTYTKDTQSLTDDIVVTRSGYTEDGSHGWGGDGNRISLDGNGITVNIQTAWNWTSATFTASASKIITKVGTDITQKMISTAEARGDAVALIDHTNNPSRPLTGANSVYGSVVLSSFTYGEFGTMFTPWAVYTTVKEGVKVPASQVMPASFGYLLSLGKSIKTNANWLAIAGVARGLVPYIQSLNTVDRLSNTIANLYQPRDNIAINPITDIKPYGLTIWGNRTLRQNAGDLAATSMLNIRNLVSDVKKVAYTTAKSLMFEQNSDVLWVNFKAGITPTLDRMLSGQGISGYKIIRGETTSKAKVVAEIKIYPLYAVEDFEITVVISDEEVSVA